MEGSGQMGDGGEGEIQWVVEKKSWARVQEGVQLKRTVCCFQQLSKWQATATARVVEGHRVANTLEGKHVKLEGERTRKDGMGGGDPFLLLHACT